MWSVLAIIATVFAGAVALQIAVSILKIGLHRHAEAKALSVSLKHVLTGTVPVDRGGIRDPRTSKGASYNIKTKAFDQNGKISDDYIKGLLES